MMDARTGRFLWEQLHFHFPKYIGSQGVAFHLWLDRVKFNLGCNACYKKLEWYVIKWPPEFGKGFELWAMCLHDYVNKELGKPLFAQHLTLEPLTRKGILQ